MDLSQLDKLKGTGSSKKQTKFQPKFVAKPRPVGPSSQPSQPSNASDGVSNPSTSQPEPPTQRSAPQLPPPSAPVSQKAVSERSTRPSTLATTSKTPAAAAMAPRGQKRLRKQAQPAPAAVEVPGGPFEPHSKDSQPPKPRGRPRKSATLATQVASPDEESPGAVGGEEEEEEKAGSPKYGRDRRTSRRTTTARQQIIYLNDETSDEEEVIPMGKVRRSEQGMKKEEDVAEAPKLYGDDKERAKQMARKIGIRKPMAKRKKSSDDEQEEEEEEVVVVFSEEEEEMEANGNEKRKHTTRKKRNKGRHSPSLSDEDEESLFDGEGDEDEEGPRVRKKVPSIADKPLDHENWSVKDVIKWANAKDRRQKKEEAKKLAEQQENTQNGAATATATQATEVSVPSQNNNNTTNTPSQVTGLGASGSRPAPVAPQVQLVNGRIVVNQETLTVQAQEKEQYRRVVHENDNRSNGMSYMSRLGNDRWSAEDTELFYKALSQFGTDFTLISQLFPGRQRKHLKNKYTRENKMNPHRVDEALKLSTGKAGTKINAWKDMVSMLKESGINVGNNNSSQQPTPLALPAPGGSGGGGGGQEDGQQPAAPLAITEHGEPASDDES